MATKQIGVVAPVPMGEWASAQTYNVLNIVTHNSSTYIAKQPSTGIEPGVTVGWGDYWMVLFNVQTDDLATKAYVNNCVDEAASASATIDGTGLISYKNSAGTTLFTLQLPIYNGGVS